MVRPNAEKGKGGAHDDKINAHKVAPRFGKFILKSADDFLLICFHIFADLFQRFADQHRQEGETEGRAKYIFEIPFHISVLLTFQHAQHSLLQGGRMSPKTSLAPTVGNPIGRGAAMIVRASAVPLRPVIPRPRQAALVPSRISCLVDHLPDAGFVILAELLFHLFRYFFIFSQGVSVDTQKITFLVSLKANITFVAN